MQKGILGKWLTKAIYLNFANILFTAVAISSTAVAFGQSETNNPITYDTTITEHVAGPSYTWYVRITRQKNDNSPRAAIFSMQGTGEVGSNPATLLTYGPHYLLANGWDGGVKLGNGTHYPILITIMEPAQNMRPWDLKAVFEALLGALPINKQAVHVCGLSQGSYEWGELIEYSASSGDFSTMSQIKSWVDLEGVGPGNNFSGFNMAYPSAFGYWAKTYGGKFFGLEGVADDRQVWQVSENMNASVPGSAFFAYENIGGGGHCCWNSMYDPSVTDWTSANANVTVKPPHANTMGNYKAGSNIFQWMLRQGDTALASSTGTSTPVTTTPPTVGAGSNATITLPTNSVTLYGSAIAASGTTMASVVWKEASGPNTASIVSPGASTTTVGGLVAGTYVFSYTGTSNAGTSASSNVTVTVNPQAGSTAPPTVSAGNDPTITLPTNSVTLYGSAVAASGTTMASVVWKEASGPNTASIGSPGASTTTVGGLVAGTYVFSYTGTTNTGKSATASVTVIVNPQAGSTAPPTVGAGSNATITLPTNSVTLYGSAVAASGTTMASVVWKEASGPNTASIGSPGASTTTVGGLVAGTYVFSYTGTTNTGKSATASVTVIVKPQAVPSSTMPTVNAGAAQSLTSPASSTFLAATASAANGTTLTAGTWKESSGPNTATINKPSGSLSTSVYGMVVGTYVFTITVTNNLGQSASSNISVVVKPGSTGAAAPPITAKAPTVNAGAAQSLTSPASSTFLAATASAASGATLSAATWKETSGPNTATINKPSGSLSTSVYGMVVGTYVFTITVTDNLGQSASSNISVVVKPGSTSASAPASTAKAPTVNAGTAQTIQSPSNSTFLNATASASTGTTLAAATWKQASGPNTATIGKPSGSLSTAVNGLVPGTYVFTITVTNNAGQSTSSNITVTVKPAAVVASVVPTVNAGTAQSLQAPASSSFLQATASTASGRKLSAATWKQKSGPNTATINKPSGSLSTSVYGMVPGAYLFTVKVTDDKGQSASSDVSVTVKPATAPAASTMPTVSAGTAQTLQAPVSSTILTATAAATGGTSLASCAWTQKSGPSAAAINSSQSMSTAVNQLQTGAYVFTMTVKNNLGQAASSDVAVTVNPGTTTAPGSGSSGASNSGSGTGSSLPVIVATGEYQTLFIDKNRHLWAVGANMSTQGTNMVGLPGIPVRVTVSPADLRFKAAASCLHGGVAVDTAGYVWTWGQGESGEIGNGNVYKDQVLAPIRITVDNNGQPFNNVASVYCYYSMNSARGTYAIKNDGTLWVWGDTRLGMAANGTEGEIVTRPTQIVLPGNRKAKQLAAGNILILLCTDGSVWTSGGKLAGVNPNLGYKGSGKDFLTLHQLDLPSNIIQVAGATNEFNYALTSTGTLYGWGSYSSYMGGTGGYAQNTYFYTPTDLTSRLNLPRPVASIVANMVCTHAILTDGTLWGWGDNAEGCVGNGHEVNFATTTAPYSWDFRPAGLLQQAPVQLTTRNDFVAVYGAGPFVMFNYAETADGQLYSWGRNKGAVLGNGIMGCTAQTQSDYPNSWDVTTITPVNPFSLTRLTFVATPICLANSKGLDCSDCLQALQNLLPAAVATLSVATGSGATTSSTTGASAAVPAMAARTTAAATFEDNTGGTATSGTVADTAAGAAHTMVGLASMGGSLTLQSNADFNMVTLDGSQSAAGDTLSRIVAYSWTQLEGPYATVVDPNAQTTDVLNLVKGRYVWQLTVTDEQGRTASALDTLVIGPASAQASNNLVVYPSIAHDNLNVVLNSNFNGKIRLNIFSGSGTLVRSLEINKDQADLNTNVSVSGLASGLYVIQAVTEGQVSVAKFIKQ